MPSHRWGQAEWDDYFLGRADAAGTPRAEHPHDQAPYEVGRRAQLDDDMVRRRETVKALHDRGTIPPEMMTGLISAMRADLGVDRRRGWRRLLFWRRG